MRSYRLPPPQSAAPDVILAALRREQGYDWLTPTGRHPGPASQQEALEQCPDLVPLGPVLVRPGALRRLSRDAVAGTLVLEGGHKLSIRRAQLRQLHQALGLDWPDSLAPVPTKHRKIYELGLRDWPHRLLDWSDEELRSRYSDDPLRLVDDVI